jgi:hypothetical protein
MFAVQFVDGTTACLPYKRMTKRGLSSLMHRKSVSPKLGMSMFLYKLEPRLISNQIMIELDNVITLHTNTTTECLSFATRYLVGINFTFDLTVLSDRFSGTSHFCVRRTEIDTLCSKLSAMHSTLIGKARLDDNDSDAYVEFEIESGGWLFVSGQVGGSHEDHFVRFTFRTDQTCIPKFLNDFKMLLHNS